MEDFGFVVGVDPMAPQIYEDFVKLLFQNNEINANLYFKFYVFYKIMDQVKKQKSFKSYNPTISE